MSLTEQQTLSDPPGEPSKLSQRETYEIYINSLQWRRRRIAYFKKYPKRCRKCESTEDIHLHHHTYRRIGAERDEDLVPLCDHCHKVVHHLHKIRKGTLTKITAEFLDMSPDQLKPVASQVPRKKRAGFISPFMTWQEVAAVLGILEEFFPKSKKRKRRDERPFRRSTVMNWTNGKAQPPKWVIEARAPKRGYRKYATYRGGGRPYSPEVQKLFDDHQPGCRSINPRSGCVPDLPC